MSNLAIVQDIYAAFGRGDIAAIVNQLTPDVHWRINYPARVPYAGEAHGPDAVARWFGTFAQAAEVTAFTPESFTAMGAHVIVMGRESARARATGRGWNTPWAHVWTLRDGRVCGFEDYADSEAIAAAFS